MKKSIRIIKFSSKIEEGDRRQETGDRRQEENYMGILTPSNFEHRVDGGVLNPQRK
ncbi:MAG: hypothetical protein F6K18_27615 [Okeania sp. SIO2C2]|uniref:hypothetical protein n=1 Tax=Okeania sp. SIO2C2 TaxID=2607787 RepID=UPI0013BD97B3|nr:hypothetical protein [Okeania sp. SIO2C2]NEP90293.1 hypothetical protein [Okeania sp. SIO2C2]